MNLLMRRLVPVLLVLFCVSCAKSPTEWQVVHSEEGGFNVAMPGPPTLEERSIGQGSNAMQLHSLTFTQGDDVTYTVCWNDYPEEVLLPGGDDRVFDGVRDALVDAETQLEKELNIEVDGHPARQLLIHKPVPGITIEQRLILVRSRLYQLLAAYPRGQAPTADLRSFFESFALSELTAGEVDPVALPPTPTGDSPARAPEEPVPVPEAAPDLPASSTPPFEEP